MADELLRIKDLHVVYQNRRQYRLCRKWLGFVPESGNDHWALWEKRGGQNNTALSILKLLPPKVGVITKDRSSLTGLN
jgi:ABC-type microcin C transport system duplicated ATPase subunit YejF